MAWILPYGASCLGGIWAYVALCRRQQVRSWVSPRSPSAVGVASEVWRFNAPRSITQIAQMSVRRADIPLVAAIAGPQAAAVYTAASRFVASGLQGIKGIQQMVGPQIARLVAAGDNQQAGMTLRTATTWNVLLAWPIYLSCAALPGLVMSLFDSAEYDYSSGESVVVILALGMLIGTAAGPVDIALLMLGRSVQSLRNNMAALITNLALNFALIPIWGINGAAFAWTVSILVSNALPTWQIRPYLGSATNRRTLTGSAALHGNFRRHPARHRVVDRFPVVATGLDHRRRTGLRPRRLLLPPRTQVGRTDVRNEPPWREAWFGAASSDVSRPGPTPRLDIRSCSADARCEGMAAHGRARARFGRPSVAQQLPQGSRDLALQRVRRCRDGRQPPDPGGDCLVAT